VKKRNRKKTLQTSQSLQGQPQLSTSEIVDFLESFRLMSSGESSSHGPSQLISMKVPKNLLAAFKAKASRLGVPYQTLIKRLMWDYLNQKKAQD
jgi:predicted DNA binding CopG/RHH family protein